MGTTTFETEVDIAASPDTVWAVMVDVEQWPTWTASVTEVRRLDDGPFGTGSRVRIRQPGFPAATWQVTALVAGESFTWAAPGLGFRTTAEHRVVPTPDGGSRVTLVLSQEGLLAGLMDRLTGAKARRFVQTEADGLKARAEAVAGAD